MDKIISRMKKLFILASLFIFLGTTSFAQMRKHHKHHKHHKHMMKHKADDKKVVDKEKR
jgi:preprotein translocase subunit YajC